MRFGTRLLCLLIALVALAGIASAQSACPECDADGEGNDENTYHNIDIGVVEEETRTLVDTDAAHGHFRDGKGLWAWFSLCLEAFLGKIEEAIGVDLGVNGNAEAYVSEDGVDLDATLSVGDERVDFDGSAVGDLDGQTWEILGATAPVRDEVDYPTDIPDYEGVFLDVCLYADLELASCG